MSSRTAVLALSLAWGLGGQALAEPIDLSGWSTQEDRILLVYLLDGFDQGRLESFDTRGEPMLPEMRALQSQATVFDDVQSSAISSHAAIRGLFGSDAPALANSTPAELAVQLRSALAQTGPQRLAFATDVFQNPNELDAQMLARSDPTPWSQHAPRHTRATHEERRRQRAELLLRLYREGRPIRRGSDLEMRWIGDAMHVRADASLAALWAVLQEGEARRRCLVILTARVGAADPQRGAPAPADALRPDLVDVPFWLLTPRRTAGRVDGPHESGPLTRSLWSFHSGTNSWDPPSAGEIRFTLHAPLEQRPPTSAIFWRTRDLSLLLRSDGAHELYDRRNDPQEWDNLASRQTVALESVRLRAAQSLLGSRITVRVEAGSALGLSVQPADAAHAAEGEGYRREGAVLRLVGDGPWQFQSDAATEFRVRSAEAQTHWYFGSAEPRTARQVQFGLSRPELQHALEEGQFAELGVAEVRVSVRAGEDGLLHQP